MRKHRLHLNLTEKCNLRCVHCYWNEFGVNPDPAANEIERVLKSFRRLCRSYGERGKFLVTFGGGEPLVRPDLESLVQLAVRNRFRVRLVTNATLLSPERARNLKRAGLSVAQVSLDGACEATHDKVRGHGSWAKTMQGIQSLKQAGVFTVLSYVLLPDINLLEAPELLDLARRLGVAGVKYARPLKDGQAVLNQIRTDADYWTVFRSILDHANQIRYRRLLLFFDPLAHLLRVEFPVQTKGLWGLSTDLCQCDQTELVEVNVPTGDIYYCRIRVPLGNVHTDDLVKLWQSHPVLVSLRRKTASGACSSCSVWNACRGGCPAVTHSIRNATMMQDGDCVKVQSQDSGSLLFQGNGLISRPPRDLTTTARSISQKARDLGYWLAFG